MAKCNNCGAKLGCACKKRTASDGKSCCANCIATYERSINTNRSASSTQDDINATATSPGVIISATAIQTN